MDQVRLPLRLRRPISFGGTKDEVVREVLVNLSTDYFEAYRRCRRSANGTKEMVILAILMGCVLVVHLSKKLLSKLRRSGPILQQTHIHPFQVGIKSFFLVSLRRH